jgi:hypothetical protein
MKKNIVKIILDIIMSVLLFLMYSKRVISISFHEIGGLIVCGLVLIHMGINRKWIVGVTKRLFDKSLPTKTKIGYVINSLLFISVTFIAISGIIISKSLFAGMFNGSAVWKSVHYFSSAIIIILAGIHIGLHWTFIKNMFVKALKLPSAVAKAMGIICLSIILIYGGYSLTTSSLTVWLRAPFSMSAISKGGMPQKGDRPEKGERPEGYGKQKGEFGKQGELPGSSSLNFGRIFGLIATYGSITGVFAFIIILIEKILKRKKRIVIM